MTTENDFDNLKTQAKATLRENGVPVSTGTGDCLAAVLGLDLLTVTVTVVCTQQIRQTKSADD